MNRQQFTTYLSETLIPDLRAADMDATADDFQTALQFICEDAERIASLEEACHAALAALKANFPLEHGNPQVGKAWGKLETALKP